MWQMNRLPMNLPLLCSTLLSLSAASNTARSISSLPNRHLPSPPPSARSLSPALELLLTSQKLALPATPFLPPPSCSCNISSATSPAICHSKLIWHSWRVPYGLRLILPLGLVLPLIWAKIDSSSGSGGAFEPLVAITEGDRCIEVTEEFLHPSSLLATRWLAST
ncbi:unnamed protein product [Urochloa humidicola]